MCLSACAGIAIEVDRLIVFVREPYIPVGVLRVCTRLHDSYRIAISHRAGVLVHGSHAVFRQAMDPVAPRMWTFALNASYSLPAFSYRPLPMV
jgi:hypothetical protein